jgi:hypothetical protein
VDRPLVTPEERELLAEAERQAVAGMIFDPAAGLADLKRRARQSGSKISKPHFRTAGACRRATPKPYRAERAATPNRLRPAVLAFVGVITATMLVSALVHTGSRERGAQDQAPRPAPAISAAWPPAQAWTETPSNGPIGSGASALYSSPNSGASSTPAGTGLDGSGRPGSAIGGTGQPSAAFGGTGQPGTTFDGTGQPGTTFGGASQPGTTFGGASRPGTGQPGAAQNTPPGVGGAAATPGEPSTGPRTPGSGSDRRGSPGGPGTAPSPTPSGGEPATPASSSAPAGTADPEPAGSDLAARPFRLRYQATEVTVPLVHSQTSAIDLAQPHLKVDGDGVGEVRISESERTGVLYLYPGDDVQTATIFDVSATMSECAAAFEDEPSDQTVELHSSETYCLLTTREQHPGETLVRLNVEPVDGSKKVTLQMAAWDAPPS